MVDPVINFAENLFVNIYIAEMSPFKMSPLHIYLFTYLYFTYLLC